MPKPKIIHETLIRVPIKKFHKLQNLVNATKKTKANYSNNAWINEAIVEKLEKAIKEAKKEAESQKLFKCDECGGLFKKHMMSESDSVCLNCEG